MEKYVVVLAAGKGTRMKSKLVQGFTQGLWQDHG